MTIRGIVICLTLTLSGCVTGPTVKLSSVTSEGGYTKEVENLSKALHHYLKGEVLYGVKNYEESVAEFSKSQKLVHIDSGAIRSRIVEISLKFGDFSRAQSESFASLKGNWRQLNEGELETVGAILDASGKDEEAILIYEELRERSPNRLEIKLLLIGLYADTGAKDKAESLSKEFFANLNAEKLEDNVLISRIKSSKALDDLSNELRLQVATSFMERRIFDGALREFSSILAKYPNHKEALFNRALILAGTGNKREALEDLLVIRPKDPKLLYDYGMLLYERGEHKKAIAQMEQVLEQEHNIATADAANFLAYHFAERKIELKRALSLIEMALKERPEDGYFLDTLAWILYAAKKCDEAKIKITQALKYLPKDVELLEHQKTINECSNQ
jgi:tetratricopeptide (TPR) repeat protein